MTFRLAAVVFFLVVTVESTHPECSIVLQLQQKEDECKQTSRNTTQRCRSEWDGLTCWPAASEGDVVSVFCPPLLLKPGTPPVAIRRSCSAGGWSEASVPYHAACYYDDDTEEAAASGRFFERLKALYAVGHALSLAALLAATLLLCCFRKLLCTRNYIHLNLFLTFMLRSAAVFIKDSELFADRSIDHCSVSTRRCKAAVTFSHLSVLLNFSWLLVEGLYLQTLLIFTFTPTRKLLWIYGCVGWGAPSVTMAIWALLKKHLDDEGCWDGLDSRLWWIIKTPVLLCVFINFLIFLNVSRIIAQKSDAPHVTHLYRTLGRSTLLLIPLLGLHYVLFALIPDQVAVGPRLVFDLVLGSFQGFIVALLYCFLNGEVQKEILRSVRRFWPETKTNAVNLPTQECGV